jgi:glycine/D-amino acid oxidase-like deaminating enzyme/nitrite reductase/ring-hydroxylating ferredoxin subunit
MIKPIPVWREGADKTRYSRLDTDIVVDVAIIGGGITGITAAHLLKQAGRRVAVLEALSIGEGTTGVSTGNLYSPVEENYHFIQSKFDKETTSKIAASRATAVNLIEHFVTGYGIGCEYQRVPWYLFTENEKDASTIDKELKALNDAGLKAVSDTQLPSPFKAHAGIRLDNQAQFNPLKYVRGLAEHTNGPDSRIYEYTKVVEYKDGEDGNPCVLHTERGHRVTAQHVIMATHMPKGFMFVQTLLGPYREYALAVKLADNIDPKGIFWALDGKEHHSIRTYTSAEGKTHLLILGEPHKVGQMENNEECFKKLEVYVRERFNVAEVEYYWGGQHYKSADTLPYIGRNDDDSNIFYATGFSTDGLTYGTLAAMIISDEIMGKKSEWSKLYDISRHNPGKAAKDFITENANVMMQYIKDLSPFNVDAKEFSEIKPGEGKTISLDGQKYAAYRDPQDNLHVVSAICTHLKCVVNWNSAEKSWDCPCHGSRFTVNGKVIEGPAIRDLACWKGGTDKAGDTASSGS